MKDMSTTAPDGTISKKGNFVAKGGQWVPNVPQAAAQQGTTFNLTPQEIMAKTWAGPMEQAGLPPITDVLGAHMAKGLVEPVAKLMGHIPPLQEGMKQHEEEVGRTARQATQRYEELTGKEPSALATAVPEMVGPLKYWGSGFKLAGGLGGKLGELMPKVAAAIEKRPWTLGTAAGAARNIAGSVAAEGGLPGGLGLGLDIAGGRLVTPKGKFMAETPLTQVDPDINASADALLKQLGGTPAAAPAPAAAAPGTTPPIGPLFGGPREAIQRPIVVPPMKSGGPSPGAQGSLFSPAALSPPTYGPGRGLVEPPAPPPPRQGITAGGNLPRELWGTTTAKLKREIQDIERLRGLIGSFK